jgi:UDP-N-acetylmuramate: L-alanyl-gamma-D-glutamyl-meso-diaminopimelate ligase
LAREHVHLIGVGGTGMTALAGLLEQSGSRVTGSDRALYPPTSTILKRLGLEVYAGFDPRHLDPAPQLVVVGNAISRGNPEVEEMLDRGLPYTSMPRLISERFLRDAHSIVVAGTHGKTTTASMLAWVLDHAGRDPGFLIGGAPVNFEYPFRLGAGRVFVIEGDEYDSAFFDKGPKFMHYRPDTILLGTVEFDHADIYRDLDQVKTAFRRLVNLVPRRGLIVRNEEDANSCEVSAGALSRIEGYGFDSGRWLAVDFREDPAGARFRVLCDEREFTRVTLSVVGGHNVRNALAVVAAAHEQGLSAEEIRVGLSSFRGVRRRLELRGEVNEIKLFDDFAHHPTAIEETLAAVRRRFRSARIWAILEPRSWSLRRNVFQDRLATVFDKADEVIVAEVYDEAAVPQELRLDPRQLVERLVERGIGARHLPDVESIVAFVQRASRPGDVIVVMSNGAFGCIHELLLDAVGSHRAASGRTST